MIFWIDAQLSPYLAQWISSEFNVEALPVRDLGLRDAKDREIFLAAREAGAVVLTKDSDFVLLLEQLGSPPQILAHYLQHLECTSEGSPVEKFRLGERTPSSW